jgi:hypothetical protein
LQAQLLDLVFDLARQPAHIVREILRRDHRRSSMSRLVNSLTTYLPFWERGRERFADGCG